MVIFFTWASRKFPQAFKLPPTSKLLLILAVVAALAGIVLATRQGRRFAATRMLKGLRSAGRSLRAVARPARSSWGCCLAARLVTQAYIGGLVASVQALAGTDQPAQPERIRNGR